VSILNYSQLLLSLSVTKRTTLDR